MAEEQSTASQQFDFPDITKAQIISVIGMIIATAASFGFDITVDQQEKVMSLSAALAGVLVFADAWLRGRRATAKAQVLAAETHANALMTSTAMSTPVSQPPMTVAEAAAKPQVTTP